METWVLVGTRPEVIKQVPVYRACIERFGRSSVKLIGTGQHRQLLDQALMHFDAAMDTDLGVMKPGASLTTTCAAILEGLDSLLKQSKPRWIVVQGDTSSAAMGAIAAFQHGVKIAHNEAGLRSYDLKHPFPEEANRKWISAVADLHFAPTERARAALLREGIHESSIRVVGNPGIDSLLWTLKREPGDWCFAFLNDLRKSRLSPVLLTAHRRENDPSRMEQWFRSLANFVEKHPDLFLVYPVHPNNLARGAAEQHLKGLRRALVCDPLDYASLCHLLAASRLVVTDSGGIQEEAATLGIPLVVCRKTTERAEAVDAGLARLADPAEDRAVLEAMEWAYDVAPAMREQPHRPMPFGVGQSGPRISEMLD